MSILQLDSNLINCSVVSSSQVMCNGKPYMLGEEDHSGTARFWIDIGVVIGLVLLAGMHDSFPTIKHSYHGQV